LNVHKVDFKRNVIRHPKEGPFSTRIAPNPRFPLSAPRNWWPTPVQDILGSARNKGGM
jgi:hypothetical protein